MTKDEIIQYFRMTKHPEGGAFVETYRSEIDISVPDSRGKRRASTGIFFLLGEGEFSAFHRIKSDEMWHFYLGDPLRVIEISEQGVLRETLLGQNILAGQRLQHVVLAGSWFASIPEKGGSYSLVGCTVAPGFEFADFELADRQTLAREFPQHAELIKSLTQP